MYCEECKAKPAVVHFTQNIQGKKTEVHLCEDCAAKKGAILFDLDNKFSLPNLLGSLLGYNYNVKGMQQTGSDISCPNCNRSFNDIRHSGKIGCSECYSAFEQELESTLRRIHGNSRHVGRIPLRGGENVLLKRKVEEYKQKLQLAVVDEKYEKAAELRDQIKKLEKDLD